jgi:hypothetical protein
MTGELLKLHGICATADIGNCRNTIFRQKLCGDFPTIYQNSSSRNATMAILHHGSIKPLWSGEWIKERDADMLRVRNALFVVVWRPNALDMVLCGVKDRLSEVKRVGQVVDTNGNPKTIEAFRRRSYTDNGGKVYINTQTLVSVLRAGLDVRQRHVEMMDRYGFRGAVLSTDNLTSLEAWSALLRSWDVVPNRGLIEQFLFHQKKHKAPVPHAESIYNYDEVVATLKASGPLAELLRL